MNKYQLLYIIKNDLSEEEKVALVDKFSELVTSLGGTVESIDKWGARKLAYPINRLREGYYVLVKFTADSTVPAEVERQMKNNEAIVRQMITRI